MRAVRLRTLLALAVVLAAVVYAALLGWLKWHEIELVYRPQTRLDVLPGDLGLRPERLRATGDDGAAYLLSIFRTAPEGEAPWVIFLHGNAANVTTSVNVSRYHQLALLGLNVVAVEYPGFGDAPGVPSEAGMVAAGTAAWRWLTRDLAVAPSRIAIYGWSLGSGVATRLAADVDEGAVVLEGAFTSVVDLAREVYPYVPVGALLRDPFASRDRIGAIGAPLLLLHARDDDIVPFAHGERLLAAAQGSRQLVPLSGGHVYPNLAAEDAYLRALYTFLSDALDTPLRRPPRSLVTALLDADPADAEARARALALARDVLEGRVRGYNRASYGAEYAGRRWLERHAATGVELLRVNAGAQRATSSAQRALGDALARVGRQREAEAAYATASRIDDARVTVP